MGLEQAHEAMENSLNGNQTETTSAEPGVELKPNTEEVSLTDLDKLDKIRFQGQDMTVEDLRKAYLRNSDYTKKTQALAQERQKFEQESKSISEEKKYVDNLQADLASIRQNPALADEFKRIYPEKYHALLDYVLANNQGQQPMANNVNPLLEKRLSQIEKTFEQQQTETYQAKVEAAEASLDNVFGQMSKKYPLADEEIVISKAQVLLDQAKASGNKHLFADEKGQPKMDMWEKVWKTVNESAQKRYEGHYKKQVGDQKLANGKAKDTASGGGIPGQAPKKMTLKEAAEAAEAHFAAQRNQ